MAKYERRLNGDFHEFLRVLHDGVISGSMTASYEDGSDVQAGETLCAVRVYERYSMTGDNRVSLNITLVGSQRDFFLSAITSGGSQATFFKLNTFGEESFLSHVETIAENYAAGR